jgi:cytochrome c-type biogenesis protein CcmH
VAPGLVWVALVLVLAATLAYSVSGTGGAPTPAQRAAALEADLKCPSCDAISVLDSSASTAAAVRQVVLTRVRLGQSDRQIENYLVGVYGPSILLRPPARGLTAVVWVVPLLAAAAGVGGLGALFWRRRRPPSVAVTSVDRARVDRALAEHGRGGPGPPVGPGP